MISVVNGFITGCRALNSFSSRDPKKFYPSEASVEATIDGEHIVLGGCLRAQWYRWFGLKDPDQVENPDYVLAALQGNAIHDMIMDVLRRTTVATNLAVVGIEVPIADEQLGVSGRVDGILQHVETKETVGLEIKSVGEYKTRQALEEPIMEHILQALYYLHYYRTHTDKDINEWLLVYFSRTDGYMTKGKKHGSPLSQMWEYRITEDKFGTKIIGAKGEVKLPWLHAADIEKRWLKLMGFIRTQTLPPADYTQSYREEQILGMYENGKLPFKYQKEAVKKWKAAGAPAGKLDLQLGDSQCKFCPAKRLCANNMAKEEVKENWSL